ncbi:MAG: hypothetical protein ACYDC3_07740 [Candidatus Binataceae bacterium]
MAQSPTKATNADIPLAFVNHELLFSAPLFDRSTIARSLFESLGQRNLRIENSYERPNPSTPPEIQTVLELPKYRCIISVGMRAVAVQVTNPAWLDAEKIGEIADSALEILRSNRPPVLATQRSTLALHVVPRETSIADITAKFAPRTLPSIAPTQALAYGLSIYAADRSILIDSSAQYPNGLFLRLVRSYPAQESIQEITRMLRADESSLLTDLGLRVELDA